MPSRVLVRLSAVIIATAVGVVAVLPAKAHTGLPFELTFPQETKQTHFRSTFGVSRSGGRLHHGNDLLAPRMTEVYAAAPGVVIHIGADDLSGRTVRIRHLDGWTSHYVHLNNDNIGTDDGQAAWSLTVAPGLEEGDFVEAGELIAWVGDSGNAESSTPHTHFELRHNGVAVDPYEVLTEAYDRARRREIMLSARVADRFGAHSIQ